MRVTWIHGNQRRFDGAAAHVVLPSEEGELSVFDFHAPMLCALEPGRLYIDQARHAVGGGIARVKQNRVTIVSHD